MRNWAGTAIRIAGAGFSLAAMCALVVAQSPTTQAITTRPTSAPSPVPAATQPTASQPVASQPVTPQPAKVTSAPASQPVVSAAEPEPVVRNGDVVVFLGDDLTDTPRPTNANTFPMLVESFITVRYPGIHARFINVGWSGDTVGRALLRLDRDVLSHKPTLVVVCLGLNDAEYLPLVPDRLAGYRRDLAALVARCQQASARVWLLSPPCVDEDKGRKVRIQRAGRPGMTDLKAINYNAALQAYAGAAKEVAAATHSGFADWFAESMAAQARARQADSDFSLTTNGLNPTDRSHSLGAATLLRAWAALPIAVNIDMNWATAETRLTSHLPASVVARAEITASGERRISLQRLPLPWPMAGGQAGFLGPDWEAAAMCRFILRVADAPERGATVRLEWAQGTASLDQPLGADQLRAGFNLAATEALNSAKESTDLYQLIGTKNYYHYGTWRKLALSPPKEAELVEAHRKLIEAWTSYVAGTEKIIQNQPRTFDVRLILAESLPVEQLPTARSAPRPPVAPAAVAPVPLMVPAATQPTVPAAPATRPAASASAPG